MTARATPLAERPYDVLLFGATGFTGKLVAAYLAEHAEALRWAIAGRSREKLDALRGELVERHRAPSDLSIEVADAHDERALARLTQKTRVVATTVGPYRLLGRELARAAAANGTSYCDLTGEPDFVRAVIDECDEVARRSKARLVNGAGYDAIPSDLVTHFVWDHATQRLGEKLAWCKVFTGPARRLSGGSSATMISMIEAWTAGGKSRELLADPHALDSDRGKPRRDPFEEDVRAATFDRDADAWTAPTMMAFNNARLVRRSHAVLHAEGGGYGPSFRYREARTYGRGPRGFANAASEAANLAFKIGMPMIPTARRMIEKNVLPPVGSGPLGEGLGEPTFERRAVAETESGKRLRGRVSGSMNPYAATAMMHAETAIALAKDASHLPERYGVLTPASAMATRLTERLRAADISFEVE